MERVVRVWEGDCRRVVRRNCAVEGAERARSWRLIRGGNATGILHHHLLPPPPPLLLPLVLLRMMAAFMSD